MHRQADFIGRCQEHGGQYRMAQILAHAIGCGGQVRQPLIAAMQHQSVTVLNSLLETAIIHGVRHPVFAGARISLAAPVAIGRHPLPAAHQRELRGPQVPAGEELVEALQGNALERFDRIAAVDYARRAILGFQS